VRIAILNWSNRRFGGTGTYLSTVMPALRRAGHQIALLHEVDMPSEHPVLPIPDSASAWSVSTLGLDRAVDGLREWQPDLLYAHGLLEPSVEGHALDVAPAVFFAHDYYGTCISGQKTFNRPVVTPCNRTFGWQCLAQYYPRRCGGLSPITMVQHFRRQRDRLGLLERYQAIVTHSAHMQQEYVKHGFTPTRVYNASCGSALNGSAQSCASPARAADQAWRLLFVGRMDRLKGGSELLHALPAVARQLRRPLHLTFAGDGPQRTAWESLASDVGRREPGIQVAFRGWVGQETIEDLYAHSDLLVLPSLWPEPLALVGLEAGRHRVPAVAYDVGGISDWLESGVNGVLAPGDPPTVEGLADAIVAVLRDPRTHATLCHGAGRRSDEFSFDQHLRLLLQVFDEVVQ